MPIPRKVLQSGRKHSAAASGGIEDRPIGLWVQQVDHRLHDGPRGVELARLGVDEVEEGVELRRALPAICFRRVSCVIHEVQEALSGGGLQLEVFDADVQLAFDFMEDLIDRGKGVVVDLNRTARIGRAMDRNCCRVSLETSGGEAFRGAVRKCSVGCASYIAFTPD
ncbi:MAG TPA: hypothetical protein VNO35_20930 [Steroidobacteraceae bacterium]|nr:hypothetical protein [Steroidobacteraceae bacterium]